MKNSTEKKHAINFLVSIGIEIDSIPKYNVRASKWDQQRNGAIKSNRLIILDTGEACCCAPEAGAGDLMLVDCIMLLRLESSRDSLGVSGRTARMRATGRCTRTLRSIACFSGDTCAITGCGKPLPLPDRSVPLLSLICDISSESASLASSESHWRDTSVAFGNL